jgi:hypothetical protein
MNPLDMQCHRPVETILENGREKSGTAARSMRVRQSVCISVACEDLMARRTDSRSISDLFNLFARD